MSSSSIWKYFSSTIFSLLLIAFFASPSFATSPPTINPGYGVFANNQSVTISAAGGATIFYTVDGSTPTVKTEVEK